MNITITKGYHNASKATSYTSYRTNNKSIIILIIIIITRPNDNQKTTNTTQTTQHNNTNNNYIPGRGGEGAARPCGLSRGGHSRSHAVSSHNFDLRNFKSRVSIPRTIANAPFKCCPVKVQVSQGLGPFF